MIAGIVVRGKATRMMLRIHEALAKISKKWNEQMKTASVCLRLSHDVPTETWSVRAMIAVSARFHVVANAFFRAILVRCVQSEVASTNPPP